MAAELIPRFEEQAADAVARCGVLPGDLLVVAVSGGPDSLALLYALARTRERTGFRLHAAHLDHGLRGAESAADAAFMADSCRKLGLELSVERADVGGFRETHRLSMEDAARRLRYGFLARVAVELGAKAVALGHTLDDQAETVLLNIIRGAGLTGLRGMSECAWRRIEGAAVLLARPLLGVSRGRTEGYCAALGLEPRDDSSNRSIRYTRNRVRHEVMPALLAINPAVRDAIIRLSESASRDLDYIEGAIDGAWDAAVDVRRDRVLIDREAFVGMDAAVGARLLRRAVGHVRGGLFDLEMGHVEGMLSMMRERAGRSMDLPGSLAFTVGYRTATIGRAGLDTCPLPPLEGEVWLDAPGETRVGGWQVVVRSHSSPVQESTAAQSIRHSREPGNQEDGICAAISSEAAMGGLWVRSRRDGDRFQPLGMDGGKKLKDFMIDSKIDRSWRDRIPLLIGKDGIAWVVGWRIAEWARPKGTGEDLVVSFVRRDKT